jgi:hypothetical protein
MALRAKAPLAHFSPIKPGSGTLSGSAKMALNHAPKVATLCQIAVFFHDDVIGLPSSFEGFRPAWAPGRDRERGQPDPSSPAAPCSRVDKRSKIVEGAILSHFFRGARRLSR